MKVLNLLGEPEPCMIGYAVAFEDYIILHVEPLGLALKITKDDMHHYLDAIHRVREEAAVFVRIAE